MDDYNAARDYMLQMANEISRLRAELAAVTAERDTLRKWKEEDSTTMRIFARYRELEAEVAAWKGRQEATAAILKQVETERDALAARAALEGVTEPASPWRDIESAPKDGTHIDLWVNGERIPDARWNDRQRRWEVWSLGDYDGMEFVSIAGNPTHWMPLPEPPH